MPHAFAGFFGLALLATPAAATTENPLQLQLSGPLFALVQDDELFADDDEGGGEEAAEEAAEESATAPPASGEVKVGGEKVGQTVGGAVGFVRSTGFYTSSDLGGFIRFGGYADGETCGFRCQPRVTSNLQPYIGLGVGYDIFDWLGVQASFGTGFVANAAPVQGTSDSPRDYGITFMNLGLTGTFWLDRFGLVGRVFGGGALLQPAPLPDELPLGGNVGGGVGIRWATLLTDVTIGLDVNGYVTFAPAAGAMTIIPGLGFAPVIKYTF